MQLVPKSHVLPQNILCEIKKDFPELINHYLVTIFIEGAQWLSDRVLDSRLKGRGIKPHRGHCVVSLSKTQFNPCLVLVQLRKTHLDIAEKLLTGM